VDEVPDHRADGVVPPKGEVRLGPAITIDDAPVEAEGKESIAESVKDFGELATMASIGSRLGFGNAGSPLNLSPTSPRGLGSAPVF
jgi:hypothetical protein